MSGRFKAVTDGVNTCFDCGAEIEPNGIIVEDRCQECAEEWRNACKERGE